MDREDHRVVEFAHRTVKPLANEIGIKFVPTLELLEKILVGGRDALGHELAHGDELAADAALEFRRRRLREGDDEHAPDRDPALDDETKHDVLERIGLPRPGARLNQGPAAKRVVEELEVPVRILVRLRLRRAGLRGFFGREVFLSGRKAFLSRDPREKRVRLEFFPDGKRPVVGQIRRHVFGRHLDPIFVPADL